MTPRLLLAPLPTEEEAWRSATPEERAAAAAFSVGRRREWLGWRALVRARLGSDLRFGYDACGAPCLVGRPERISVAHTQDRLAVLLADAPCAVDIERADRDLKAVGRRILTPAERLLSTDPLYPVVACCAKEALYKYAHGRLQHIGQGRIEAVGGAIRPPFLVEGATATAAPAGSIGSLTGRIGTAPPLRLTVCRFDDHIVVCLL